MQGVNPAGATPPRPHDAEPAALSWGVRPDHNGGGWGRRWPALLLLGPLACAFSPAPGAGSGADGGDGAIDGGTPTDGSASPDGPSPADAGVDAQPPCPARYDRAFGASSYHLPPDSDRRTWAAAAAACGSDGGRLAIIRSAAQNLFVADQLLAGGAGDWAWIGLRDDLTEGSYYWADGSALGAADFQQWNPRIGDDADCVNLFAVSQVVGYGNWGDYYCDVPKPYLCECAR